MEKLSGFSTTFSTGNGLWNYQWNRTIEAFPHFPQPSLRNVIRIRFQATSNYAKLTSEALASDSLATSRYKLLLHKT
ncbi:hypothetical protein [Tolypothrix sp. VBCCA 56010]|uniref:hypothetical protein n=1 Tax=Tolypothrix sp. VBCCA 56010 TaxID=3137731 RepID=UPI003D7CA05C